MAAYEQALKDARTTLDLTALFDLLDEWRARAAIQADPVAFAQLVRRAAERMTGEPVPTDEPLSITRAKIGM